MRRVGGFTLLELVVALVVTSLVALLAYGTVSAGYDSQGRLERHRSTTEAHMLVRALLLDALRHVPEGGGALMNDVIFSIEDRTGPDGLPTDALGFLSRGLVPPLGGSGTWWVTLAASDEGVRLYAAPLDPQGGTAIDALLPAAHGLDVHALGRSDERTWSERFDELGRVPAAVLLEFLSERGLPVVPPLVVRSALEDAR